VLAARPREINPTLGTRLRGWNEEQEQCTSYERKESVAAMSRGLTCRERHGEELLSQTDRKAGIKL